LRASLAIGKRVATSLLLPLLDAVFIYGGMVLLAFFWQTQILDYKYSNPPDFYFKFPDYYFLLVIPCYIIIWLVAVAFSKGYHKPYSAIKTNRGIILGTVAILLIYALLPETMRFSRTVTVLGAVWTAIAMNALRYLFHLFKLKGYQYDNTTKRRVLIVGSLLEAERVAMIAQAGTQKPETIMSMEDNSSSEIKNHIQENKINELIFCSKDVTIKQIIAHLVEVKSNAISIKIAPENEQVIIGSRNIQQPVSITG
jgi:FlaA1/EpsC-like NDP-sugar epimerase